MLKLTITILIDPMGLDVITRQRKNKKEILPKNLLDRMSDVTYFVKENSKVQEKVLWKNLKQKDRPVKRYKREL